MTEAAIEPPGKALALVSYARAMSLGEDVDTASLRALVNEVCTSRRERQILLSRIAEANTREIGYAVADLLAERVARLREAEGLERDIDDIYGKWGQRVSGGALLAGAGAAIGGVVTGGGVILAIALPLAMGAVVTAGRLKGSKRYRRFAREREDTESLLELTKTATADLRI
ncbi:hypothetical protein [Algicella marina]|uniref:Uncharacterized protein n=1 Tax=Algicella marina TaxID=2683284 RepID=A0A6P1T2L6_9RHOB|nr:hypothetical protein [Algicella marina]QHQ34752.1 hypothetical protein GO499_05865 [Algicella marina]